MSLFGKRTADPIQGSPAQKPSPFSTQTNNTGSLFGSSLSTQAQNTPSIFGTQNQASSNPTQASNLFGTPSNNQSNSLFGGSANTQSTTPQSNNLFGSLSNNNNNNNNSTQPTTQSNNLFGSLSNNNNGNNNNTTQPTPQSNNLFGSFLNNNNNTNNNNNNNTNNLSTTGFGTQISSTPANSFLYNSTNNLALNRSAPPTTNNALSTLRSSTAQLARRPITLSELSIQDRIIKIHASWNVSDPQCQFQFFFYNVVPPEQVHLYGRPNQLAPDDPRWQRAKRNNPDPSRLVPTLAIGFEDLSKRVTVQQKQAQVHLLKLGEISNRLNEIARKHNLETSSRLHKLKTEQVKLSTRLMGLVNKLNGIVLHSSSSSALAAYQPHSQPGYQHQQLIRNNHKEEELMQRIKTLKAILDQFGGKSKISELWSALHQIKNFGGFFVSGNGTGPTGNQSVVNHGSHHSSTGSGAAHQPGHSGFIGVGSGDGGGGKWSVTDDKEIKKVLEILLNQQKGIDHLILLLRKCRADVILMRQAFNLESNLKSIEW
ncbi:hypothetical protein PGT21_033716 [Puccinia graminis f. sp. tritici]|uniref:Nucleoporin Nup54 alpha-helical domain-containing protein n=1 Tax=Puccinia graminis f. sp. tritici TaxID=56615 RepID=A0A5B0QKF3_PUCGR|nr:hypothetical protein PGT21_033716 [Puccinia graminis f. sp. tritici]